MIIVHENTDSFTIICNTNRIVSFSNSDEEITFEHIPIFLLKLNKNNCIESSKLLTDNISLSDTTALLESYEKYVYEFNKPNDETKDKTRKLLKLSFDLRDAILLGCITCRNKLFQIESNFSLLESGTYAQEHYSNCDVVNKISLLLKNK